ncbi:hypothetical protein [Actinoplanes sp. NPDC020271]|uniref:hypothetical protein n=1 Tax=Actinoplanes sp. NPDC020271 TaxID=3363896 RepID=UPI0037AB2BAF
MIRGPRPFLSPSRSSRTPEEVVDNYLRERLVERDDAAAKLLRCQAPSVAPMDACVAGILDREKRFGFTIDSTWAGRRTSTGSAVQADLTRTVSERLTEHEAFGLADENGRKVCAAATPG